MYRSQEATAGTLGPRSSLDHPLSVAATKIDAESADRRDAHPTTIRSIDQEVDKEITIRQPAPGPLGPFDYAHAVSRLQILVVAEALKVRIVTQPVQIEVVKLERIATCIVAFVLGDQGESRT